MRGQNKASLLYGSRSAASAGPLKRSSAQSKVRWMAYFQPEVWEFDYAVPTDALGPQLWDCSQFVCDAGLTNYLEGVKTDDEDRLIDDPQAPAWIREWDGPFTISINRIDSE
jgi:hypothetical protein